MERKKHITVETRFLGVPIRRRKLTEENVIVLNKRMARSDPFDTTGHWTVGNKLSVRFAHHWNAEITEVDESVLPPTLRKREVRIFDKVEISRGRFISHRFRDLR
jgi:hypothetical protein